MHFTWCYCSNIWVYHFNMFYNLNKYVQYIEWACPSLGTRGKVHDKIFVCFALSPCSDMRTPQKSTRFCENGLRLQRFNHYIRKWTLLLVILGIFSISTNIWTNTTYRSNEWCVSDVGGRSLVDGSDNAAAGGPGPQPAAIAQRHQSHRPAPLRTVLECVLRYKRLCMYDNTTHLASTR